MLPKPGTSRLLLRVIHRYLFFNLNFRDAFLTLIGKVQNSIPFTVVADPASVYINYRIRPDQLEAFIQYINLPAGMHLSPIQCLDNEEADYLLTQNIYEVTGLAKGLRCEWSTYIKDDQGIPRYLILEARSSKRSMDPINIITSRSRIEHSMTDTAIDSVVESNDGQLFKSTIQRNPEAPYVRLYGEWIAANDYIYWRNGVIDRTYYGAGLANAKVRKFDLADFTIDDQTHWAPLVDAAPKHVLQCEGSLDFSVVMWSNV